MSPRTNFGVFQLGRDQGISFARSRAAARVTVEREIIIDVPIDRVLVFVFSQIGGNLVPSLDLYETFRSLPCPSTYFPGPFDSTYMFAAIGPDPFPYEERSMVGQPELWESHRGQLEAERTRLGVPIDVHLLHFDISSPFAVAGNPQRGRYFSLTPICGQWQPFPWTRHPVEWNGYYDNGVIQTREIDDVVVPLTTTFLSNIPPDVRRSVGLVWYRHTQSADRFADAGIAIYNAVREQVDAANARRANSATLSVIDSWNEGWVKGIVGLLQGM